MINTTLSTSIPKNTSYGVRLKTAREALGMDRKEAAAQLRLNETVIIMIEKGEYKTSLPLTFIRGYIRSYSKLLEIPEKELKEALDLLQPKVDSENEAPPVSSVQPVDTDPLTMKYMPINFGNFFMKLFTYLIAITLIGLVGVWWHTHKTSSPHDILPPIQAEADSDVSTGSTHPSKESSIPSGSKNTAIGDNARTDGAKTGASVTEKTPTTATTQPVSATTKPVIAKTQPIAAPIKIKFIPPTFSGTEIANHFTQVLADLILFLIIITVGMRLYAPPSNKRAMAETRVKTMPSNFPAFTIGLRKLTNYLPELRTVVFAGAGLFAIIGLGVGATWTYKQYKNRPVVITPVKQVDKTTPVTKQEPVNIIPIDTDLETLAPSPDFNSVMLANIKVNDLQSMANQLDTYIAQAAAIKFALTDKSTEIGQFIYKKKSRRYRQYRKNTNTFKNPTPNYNNNGNTIAPPYYYFH